MDVILLERVEKLGAIGDVVSVKDGYARNFLLPNKKALRSNEANRKVFESNRARIESDNATKRAEAEKEAGTFKDASITLIRQASNAGQLYGSVAVRDLIEALVADGHKVGKSAIVLNKPIKAIGLYDVKVSLHPEVSVNVKVNVARSPEEAEMQAEGVDVMAAMFEESRDESGFVESYDASAEPGTILDADNTREERAEAAVDAAEERDA